MYANCIVSNNESSDSAIKAKLSDDTRTDGVYEITYKPNFADGRTNIVVDETDTYNTLRKQHKNCDITDNPYDHVRNVVNDVTYSICFSNPSSNGRQGTNNIYAHFKDAVKHSNSTDNVGNGDGVYNILQQKHDRHRETSKQPEEISDYDTTNVALSTMGSDGYYSNMNEVELNNFDGKDKELNM